MKENLKAVLNALFSVFTLPSYVVTALWQSIFGGEDAFHFFAHAFSGYPGKFGEFTRRAFYRWTLDSVGGGLVVGYGSFFTHRNVDIDRGVWIGQYSIIGRARIRSNVLISDHVSILSGRHHHKHLEDGTLAEDSEKLITLEVGESSWIGAGAVIMAGIGEGSIVGAGSVVVSDVPPSCVVAGNPAEIKKELKE